MEFQNGIKTLAEKIQSFKGNTKTEEATKTAFILPFLRLLGYDDSNPTEVIPEFTADFGNKKHEKVDYAIFQNGKPTMIIECKHWAENLNVHSSQLFRYFNATQTRFGLLTNGIVYKFYTDLVETNKMDEEPFLEFDFENIKENVINELRKFQKETFDIEKIVDSASELKYSALIRSILEKELSDPTEDFVRFFGKQIYSGKLTAKILEQFTSIVKRATNQAIKEIVSDRLQSALKKEEETAIETVEDVEDNLIETTEEELEGFMIVKSIIRVKGEISKIQYKDNQNYFAIYYDKQTQPICRLHFNRAQKYIGLIDENKKEDRVPIESLDDIYSNSDKLLETIGRYE